MSNAEYRVKWGGGEYDNDRYQTKKLYLISLLGGICVKCGTDKDLEFDHIDPKTKKFSILEMWNKPMEVLLPELEKCQLLCVSCHKAKGRARATVPHGGGKRGKHNCPCAPCKAKKAEYMKARKRL